MTQRFKNALDALVYAFFNDTLAAGTCSACAVGNICAWSFGYKKKSIEDSCTIPESSWDSSDWDMAISANVALDVIIKTGYTRKELARVEKAFEKNSRIKYYAYDRFSKEDIMQDQYNGLMAVLDVLCEIEGIEDPAEYKELFALPQ